MTFLPLLCLAFAAPQDAPILHSTFTLDGEGWVAVQPAGAGGEVSVVHDPVHTKVGTGALRLTYALAQGQVSAAALPIAEGAVAKMASVRFWVRPDQNTPLALALQEKGGGRYIAMFSAAKDKWQEVALGLQDFVLSAGENDPKDPDGKLDPDAIESISIVDLDQVFAQNAAAAGVLGIPTGPRAVYLSDFQVLNKPLAGADAAMGSVLDAFAGPQPNWAALNAEARVVSEAPLNARALRLDYNLPSGKAAAAFKKLKAGTLAGKSSLALRIAAKSACRIVVQLEETGGGKYDATLSLPAGGEAADRTLAFADMKAAADSKDGDGKLDPEQIAQITIIDITAMTDAPGRNTLWIGRIAAKP